MERRGGNTTLSYEHIRIHAQAYTIIGQLCCVQSGESALIQASYQSHDKIVTQLLEQKANVDLQDEVGKGEA